jgi:hypothetical protein
MRNYLRPDNSDPVIDVKGEFLDILAVYDKLIRSKSSLMVHHLFVHTFRHDLRIKFLYVIVTCFLRPRIDLLSQVDLVP